MPSGGDKICKLNPSFTIFEVIQRAWAYWICRETRAVEQVRKNTLQKLENRHVHSLVSHNLLQALQIVPIEDFGVDYEAVAPAREANRYHTGSNKADK